MISKVPYFNSIYIIHSQSVQCVHNFSMDGERESKNPNIIGRYQSERLKCVDNKSKVCSRDRGKIANHHILIESKWAIMILTISLSLAPFALFASFAIRTKFINKITATQHSTQHTAHTHCAHSCTAHYSMLCIDVSL